VIRTTINLARRPAENLRRIRVVWGGAVALLGALFLILGTIALIGWLGSRPIQKQTNAVRADMAPLVSDSARIQAPLANPHVRLELDQAAFFNQLIDRKSVSWTRLFERLEQIMPPGVELVSLRPQVRDGQSAIDIRFASDTLEPAIDFVHQLESSSDFSGARVERETEAAQTNNLNSRTAPPPRFQLEVTALYHPAKNADTTADLADGGGPQ
jgi:hypothetical protein